MVLACVTDEGSGRRMRGTGTDTGERGENDQVEWTPDEDECD